MLGIYLSLQVKPYHYQLGMTSSSEPCRFWVSLWGLFPEFSDPRVHKGFWGPDLAKSEAVIWSP